MTNDEWIKAANYMVVAAEEGLEQAPGGFMRNFLEAQRSLARAYFAADGSNQKMMREMFHAIFWRAHAERLENNK